MRAKVTRLVSEEVACSPLKVFSRAVCGNLADTPRLGRLRHHLRRSLRRSVACVPLPDADDKAETTGASRGDADCRILENRSTRWSTPRRRAASRNISGAGFPRGRDDQDRSPSTRASKSAVRPAACRISAQWWLDEATAGAHATLPSLAEKSYGGSKHLHAFASPEAPENSDLCGWQVHERFPGSASVPRFPHGHVDTARGEKAQHACDARFAIDIAAIVSL